MKRGLACVLVLAALVTSAAQAQPRGPRDIITGAQKARAQREMQQAVQPPAGEAAPKAETAPSGAGDPHGASAQPGGADPHGEGAPPGAADPHGAAGHAGMPEEERPPVATERPAPSLPTGTIEVRVFEPSGAPASGAALTLGIMHSDGNRETKNGRADRNGVARWNDLPFGDKQAYRVNAPYQGARYSSTPFRLPHQGGYQVEIHRLPVTHDTRMVVLYVGATSVELKDDRLKVVQQSRLVNLGGATYVFPEQGTLVKLPEGFMAVQTEDVMTDQKVTESKGEGVRVTGSLPPGETTLIWGFDLPLTDTQARIRLELPWLVFAYRVLSDAPEGMTLAVDEMPEPVLHEDSGRRMFVTEMQRKVGDPEFSSVRISLTGIPGPGPGRWIAAALALLAVALGGLVAWRGAPAGPVVPPAVDLEARKARLLAKVKALDAEHAAGEIGPQFHAEALARLTDELASVLRETALARETASETAR